MAEGGAGAERFVVQQAKGKKRESLTVHETQAAGAAAFSAAVQAAPRAFLRLIRLQADPQRSRRGLRLDPGQPARPTHPHCTPRADSAPHPAPSALRRPRAGQHPGQALYLAVHVRGGAGAVMASDRGWPVPLSERSLPDQRAITA